MTTSPTQFPGSLSGELFVRIRDAYRRRWGIPLRVVDADGGHVIGPACCERATALPCRQTCAFAVAEALRWGEPTIEICPGKRLIWAVPLMHNQDVLGGLLASIEERVALSGAGPTGPPDIRRACADLREQAEAANLTNAAALRARRDEYAAEQSRAYALHEYKGAPAQSIRQLYLREEPALFSAIRAGDRRAAREILNRILVAIHAHAGERIDLVKSFFLELVGNMSRTAVEAGVAPEKLLGANYATMSDLAGVRTDRELADWLSATLERMMDAIHAARDRAQSLVLFGAIDYLRRHCCQRISRDDVAQAVGLSPSYFSTLIHREAGLTFTELLNRMRADRAAELLAGTDKPLSLIALETGFSDQSYFTKVFRRCRGMTPRDYRQQRADQKE